MASFSYALLVALLLLLIYAAAALPWAVLAFDQRRRFRTAVQDYLRHPATRAGMGRAILIAVGLVVATPVLVVFALFTTGDPATLETVGMLYGATLQLQLI